jgi:hypothetical protein
MSRLSCRSFMSCRVRWENAQGKPFLPCQPRISMISQIRKPSLTSIRQTSSISVGVRWIQRHNDPIHVYLYIYTRATWWESRKAGLDNFAYSIFLKIAIAVYLGVYRCKLRHTLVSLALTWLLARLGVLLGPNGPNLHCVAEWRFPWSKETNSLGSEVPKFLSSGRGIKWMIKSKQRYLNIFTSYPNLRLYPIYPLRLNLLACQRVELSVIGEVCVN